MADSDVNKSFILKVAKGSLVWIPYGYMAIPLIVEYAKAESENLRFIMASPIYNSEWAKAVPANVGAAILSFSKQFLDKQEDSKCVDRAALFTKQCESFGWR